MINPFELLFSVDEHNNPIEPQLRKLSHETGIWHRTVHVWIINDADEILCQKRSLQKDMFPGMWEPFFGGHLQPGNEYTKAAQIELNEELGLEVVPELLRQFTIYKCSPLTEFQAVYTYTWNGDSASLVLEPDEVDEISWKSIDEVRSRTVNNADQTWTIIGYEAGLLDWIQNR